VKLVQRCAAVIALLAATLAAAVLGAPAAGAHTDLVGSDPAADTHLEAAPAAVTLRFASPPMELGATVLVVDERNEQWNDGEATVAGTAVSVPLRPGAPDGWYQVRWRVLSPDGDLVSGAFDFGVGDLTGHSKVQLAENQRVESGGDFDIEPQRPAPTATETTSDGRSPLRTAALAVLGALAGVGVFALGTVLFRGRRGPHPTSVPKESTP
jgi:methionine-rich copper-binding protein CopC